MLSLAWKEITRRASRAVLAIIGFLLVALLIAAGQCMGKAINKATAEPLDVTGADLVVIRQVVPCAFAPVKRPKDLGAITSAELDRIRNLEGVASASGTLVVWAFDGGQPTVTTGVTPGSVKTSGPLKQYRSGERCCVLESGRLFDPRKNETVLDKDFAAQRGVGIDDMVRLGPEDFKVVGILKVAGVAVIGGGEAYVPLNKVQAMLGEGDVFDYVFVTAMPDADLAAISTSIEEIIGDGCQVSSQTSLPGQISRSIAFTSAGSGVFVALILAVGALLIVRSALSSVRERVVEIGILKAVGWRNRHVMSLLGSEMVIQGALGAIPGTLLGYGLAFIICSRLNLQLPGSFNSYPPCATTPPAMSLTLLPEISVGGVAVTLALTAALAVVAGLAAGYYASSRAPMDSLRQP